jgi:AraC family carnitine catabolism transcriptional activator
LIDYVIVSSYMVKSVQGPQTSARRIGILLLPSFSHLTLSSLTEPLFVANWLSQSQRYRWRLLSLEGTSVEASSGLRVRVDGGIGEDDRFDAVFLLASFEPKRHAADRHLRAWLRKQARHGAELGGIETGSEALAAAGLLAGYEVATHWDNLPGFQELYPDCRASSRLYTIERGRLTCAGASAVLDMAIAWIGSHHGPALASEIAQHLLLRSRPAGDDQLTASAGKAQPLLQRVLALMEQTIEEPLSCAALARRLKANPRRLQRLFRRELASTPSQQYRKLRLAKAHALLQQTDLPVTEVAFSAGFSSPAHFSRLYRRSFGRPPSADRKQTTDAPVFRRRA